MTPEEAEALCADGLRRLDALMRRGEGDSEAADAVRDEMDVPWRRMTPEGIERIRKLSIALYAEWEDDANATRGVPDAGPPLPSDADRR